MLITTVHLFICKHGIAKISTREEPIHNKRCQYQLARKLTQIGEADTSSLSNIKYVVKINMNRSLRSERGTTPPPSISQSIEKNNHHHHHHRSSLQFTFLRHPPQKPIKPIPPRLRPPSTFTITLKPRKYVRGILVFVADSRDCTDR